MVKISPYAIPGIKLINARHASPELRNEIFNNEFLNVCELFGENPEKVRKADKKRNREFVVIRQVCMALFRKKHRVSLNVAGAWFGKDHATVLHAIRTIRDIRATDRHFKAKTDPLFNGVNLNDETTNYTRNKRTGQFLKHG